MGDMLSPKALFIFDHKTNQPHRAIKTTITINSSFVKVSSPTMTPVFKTLQVYFEGYKKGTTYKSHKLIDIKVLRSLGFNLGLRYSFMWLGWVPGSHRVGVDDSIPWGASELCRRWAVLLPPQLDENRTKPRLATFDSSINWTGHRCGNWFCMILNMICQRVHYFHSVQVLLSCR